MIGRQQEVFTGPQARATAGELDEAPGALPLAVSPARPANVLRRYWRYRPVRFAAVAASCTLGQLLVLAWLVRLGVSEVLANGTGFAASAQANFVLSAHVTWHDRKPQRDRPDQPGSRARGKAWTARWAAFNAAAVAALAVNELVFTIGTRAGAQLLVASAIGIAAGAALTFTLNNFVTFRAETARKRVSAQLETRPGLPEISERAQRDGVAFFLPAFNEAANLRIIVPGIVDYFDQLNCPFTVIIVDDGSTEDDTFEAAEQLARHYPGNVRAVHHAKNKGYGAALQTGFRAALDTGHGLIGFCDADDQFEIASFGTLLGALQEREADLAVGYRIARADSLKRRVMGRSWHWLSSLVLGARTARDVDCGFKLFTRAVLQDVEPRISGGYAAVSPEVLTRATSAGYTMAEAGVTHKSRTHGRQTGSDLKVVILSLAYLFQLRLALRTEN
jgi:putative flippase GtrA